MPQTSPTIDAVEGGGAFGHPALVLRGVEKSYGGVRALRGIDFTCLAGEVHALLGENGAGKSTLVNVAAGNVVQDAGSVEIRGVELPSADPALARELGLAVAYQEDSLIPDLTVAENLRLAARGDRRPTWSGAVGWAAAQLERFGTRVDPATPVRELPVAARQVVEIVKALVRDPTLLVLDEPTAALTAAEASRLHDLVRGVAGRGTGVVYITHRLTEVLVLADRISILRDGAMVASEIPRTDVDEERLVSSMVGRSIDTTFPTKAAAGDLGEVTVALTEASGRRGFSKVSFEARAGEILGLAGVEGNGQREVLRAVAGLDRADGRLEIGGREVTTGSVRAARRAGVAFVSGDRGREAAFPGLSVRENMSAGALDGIDRLGVVTRRRERQTIAPQLQALAVRMPSEEHPVASLSGGNQQKVALGRALLERPSVYLVEEPTQGVDPATRVEIYRMLREEARRGATVVAQSSDALELSGLCDRVLVFSRGHAIAELTGEQLSEDRIVGAAAQSGVSRMGGEQATVARSALLFARRNDFAPVLLLLASIACLLAFVTASQPTFLSTGNVANLLYVAVPLGFVALGQAAVMMTGGIDLSLGPLVSLTTVLMASVMSSSAEAASTLLAILVALAAGGAVGLLNALLVRKVKLQPLIATLATYVFVQGLALLIMKTPGGYISRDFASAAGQLVGFLPLAFIGLVALAALAEIIYRRWPSGLSFRSVGSRPAAARRLGVRSERVYYLAYVGAGLMGAVAGIFFSASIQIGDPTLGVPFTLASVTAVVLGGMSTWGGRGSIIGAVAGALLLGVIANGSQFVGYPPEVQYYAQGGLLIGAIALYSKLRATGASRDETATTA